jgi:hypothetical protein
MRLVNRVVCVSAFVHSGHGSQGSVGVALQEPAGVDRVPPADGGGARVLVHARLGRPDRPFSPLSHTHQAHSFEQKSHNLGQASASVPIGTAHGAFVCVRNLQEWIVFHLLMGVERVFLFVHDSDDQTVRALAPFIEAGVVETGYISGKNKQCQVGLR